MTNILSALPLEIRAILPNLTKSNNSLPSLCKEIKYFNLSNHQKNALVLWMIKFWSTSKANTCQKFGAVSLNVEVVVEFVERIQLEKEFCQILLLLPEQRKRKLISELCDYINENKDNHRTLRTHLLSQTSSDYVQNFMTCIELTDDVTIAVFCENLRKILDCTVKDITKDKDETLLNLLLLLDSILLDIPSFETTSGTLELNKYGGNVMESPSLLNKSDLWQVQQLAEQCKRGGYKIAPAVNREESILKKLMKLDIWSEIYMDIFASTLKHWKAVVNELKEGFEDLVITVAMKVKNMHASLKSSKGSILCNQRLISSLEEFLQVLANTFTENDLVVYVCEQASVEDVLDLYRTSKYKNVFYSLWNLEKDERKRFCLAISILNNTLNSHSEVFQWLLGYHGLSRDQAMCYVQSLCAYTVNYGTPSLVMSYLERLYEHKQLKNHTDVLIECIFNIALQCLPYLTTKSIDTLIPRCQKYYDVFISTFWHEKYTKEDFYQEMNESFNKMTDDSKESGTVLHMLAVVCFIAPYLFVKEMFVRVFSGMLKYSTVGKVFSVLPSILQVTFVDEKGDKKSVMTILSKVYILNKDAKASNDNLVGLLKDLCKCGKPRVQQKTVECIIDEYVYPNLGGTEAFLNMSTVMMLISELQADEVAIPFVQLTLLLEIVMPFLNTGPEEMEPDLLLSIDENYEVMNQCIKRVVVSLRGMYEGFNSAEKEACIQCLKQLIEEHDWAIQFFFKDFLSSVAEEFHINVSRALYEFLAEKQHCWISFEHKEYAEQVNSHWIDLFEVYIVSRDHGDSFIPFLPAVSIDDEMENIIQAIVKIFTKTAVNKFKTLSILHGLQQLIEHDRLKGVESYFPDNLQNERSVHGKCFGVLILMQCFTSLFDNVSSDDLNRTDQKNLQTFPKILNIFIAFAKELKETPRVQSSFCMYIFELVLYAVAMFDEPIAEYFSLFLMDLLVLTLKNFSTNCRHDNNEIELNFQKCKELLESIDSEHLSGLKTKFDAFMNKTTSAESSVE